MKDVFENMFDKMRNLEFEHPKLSALIWALMPIVVSVVTSVATTLLFHWLVSLTK